MGVYVNEAVTPHGRFVKRSMRRMACVTVWQHRDDEDQEVEWHADCDAGERARRSFIGGWRKLGTYQVTGHTFSKRAMRAPDELTRESFLEVLR